MVEYSIGIGFAPTKALSKVANKIAKSFQNAQMEFMLSIPKKNELKP